MAAKEDFAWSELLSDKLIIWKRDKVVDQLTNVPTADLNGKYVGIFFSAHWCPPCRKFTPLLMAVYHKLQQEGKQFEVVFVSMDKSKQEFHEYFGTQPWLAVPYSEELLRTKLRQRYEVDGIPHLVMLDPNGKVLCSNARTGIMADPQGHKFPWASHSNMRTTLMLAAMLAFVLFWVVSHLLFGAKNVR